MNTYSEDDRKRDFDFFIENYEKLYQKYGHKFLVIRNQEILGSYDSELSAINITSEKYPIGSFIVQECNGDESAYTNYISSWQLIDVR